MGENKNRLDWYKVLAAANVLQTFTIDALHRHAQVSRDSAYKVLNREKLLFEVVEEIPGPRGRPAKRYRIIPTKAKAIQARLNGLREELRFVTEAKEEQPTNLHAAMSPELLAAEHAVFEEFIESEDVELKSMILRRAIEDKDKDAEFAAASPSLSQRRQVVGTLLRLCALELQVQYSHVKWGAAPKELVLDVMRDLIAVMPGLSEEYADAIRQRFLHSPVSKLLLASYISASVAAAALHAPRARKLFTSTPWWQDSLPADTNPCHDLELIKLCTTAKEDNEITDVAERVRSEIEKTGMQIHVQNLPPVDKLEAEQKNQKKGILLLVACNSGRDPVDLPDRLMNFLGDSFQDMCFLDVKFKPSFMNSVYQRGAQYIPNINKLWDANLIQAVQPLHSLLGMVEFMRALTDNFNLSGSRENEVKPVRRNARLHKARVATPGTPAVSYN